MTGAVDCLTRLRQSGRGKGTTIDETTTDTADSPDTAGTTFTGADVMAWFDSDDAERQARRLAARRGLGGYDALSQNVLADARVSVWNRMRSSEPLRVDNPAGYGTQVIRSVLRQLAEGRDGPIDLVGDHGALERTAAPGGTSGEWFPASVASFADTAGDDVRVILEQLGDDRAWVSSASLTYLTLVMEPTARPDDAPWPRSGSTEDQARCWPGLWYAGERDLFDEGVDTRDRVRIRRTRARRIAAVLDRVRRAESTYQLEFRGDRG